MTITIREQAPVKARSSGLVGAAPEVVWNTLTDLSAWPRWNRDVSSMIVEGPLAPGTRFRWKAGGLTIVSELAEVVPITRIVWTGRTMGISAVHVWELEPREQGTFVSTAESFEGILPRLVPGPLRRTLQSTLDKGIEMLRAACETGAGPVP